VACRQGSCAGGSRAAPPRAPWRPVLHLVEEEHRPGTAALCDLADFDEQHRQVALGIAAVRGPAGRFDVQLGGEAETPPEGLRSANA
jgi:hypothetical protein